ncbi:MAG: 50S ribosomal protein L15 [Nitrospira sp. SB0677_bin_15]|nr:50S ribosomal protein L15 [Nitrospira sp. SB0667_bin_9]MYD30368.1 50S ribosomal protein L15 [Nitrospira sp. SB0661_bin_20]MYG41044.1 50S ribosomal protein L15 [Nitrospira sp. SB0677_bin_15]MYH01260.1 50S ribosomal protein L15 [Nitrospira sp. SB0675_bin_23]MYJ22317.1 50S ribosomal protein L15 [Nitrospira sp. SB0673_bin_12]
MKLHQLQPAPGSRKSKKRLGRGPGSGLGKTAGKGHKGMLARSGRANVAGFEGGQMPLARRLPKRGFHNPFRTKFAVVNLKTLAVLDQNVTLQVLYEKRIVKKQSMPIKILGVGELDKPMTIEAHKFSQSALRKIEQAGGQAKVIGRA